MYDDVYGHSVEEHDLCVSPTTGRSSIALFGMQPVWVADHNINKQQRFYLTSKKYKTFPETALCLMKNVFEKCNE